MGVDRCGLIDGMDTARPLGPRGLIAVVVGAVVVLLVALTARTEPVSPVHQVPELDQPSPTEVPSLPPVPEQPSDQPNPFDGLEQTEPNPVLQFVADLVVAILVIGAVAVVALIVVVVVRRVAGNSTPDGIDETDGEVIVDVVAVSEHLDRSSAELTVDGDVNQAIVRCWEGLEHLVEDAGAVRDPAQTAREFTRSVLATADLPAATIDRLADLYEAALFSGEQLPEQSRADAVRCLEQLREAVPTEVGS